MLMEKETGLQTGWTAGLFSTGAGGSPGRLLLECSSPRSPGAELSDSSLTVIRSSV